MKQYLRFSFLLLILSYTQIFSQSIEVSGIVVEGESHTPLVGVNILAGESGTTSNETGTFSIIVQDGFEISFSYISSVIKSY